MGTTERNRFLWSDVVNGFHGICPPRTSWILPCRARACCMSQTLVEGSTSKGGWRFELPISKSKETRTVCRVDKLPAPLFAGPFHVWGFAGGIGVLARSNFEAKSCSAKTIKDCSQCCAVTEFTSIVLYIYHSESQMDPEVYKKPLVYKQIIRRMSEMMDTQQRLMTKCSSFQKVQVCSMLNCL